MLAAAVHREPDGTSVMNLDAMTLLTILGMAIATYLTRILGFLPAGRPRLPPRVAAAFEALPPAVLTAVIAPAVLVKPSGSLRAIKSPEVLAAAITVLAALRCPFSP